MTPREAAVVAEAKAPEAPRKTRGEIANEDISTLIRAKNTLLWIVTREERRVEKAIVAAANDAKYGVVFWDVARGVTAMPREKELEGRPLNNNSGDPDDAMRFIRETKTANEWKAANGAGQEVTLSRWLIILRDFHKWIPVPTTLRRVRNNAMLFQSVEKTQGRCMVILAPNADVPPELMAHTVVIDYPIPDREEVRRQVEDVSVSARNLRGALPITPELVESTTDAAVGLTADEISNCLARSLTEKKGFDPALVSREKKRVIAREKILTWVEPDPRGLDAVGGLEVMKQWLVRRRKAFTPAARARGLKEPRGLFLTGVPGSGKSLTAKCVASAWGMPLLRLDLGAMKSKYVGESEQNIRKALQTAEAVAPAILWVDEIEKSISGGTGQQGDGGVSADANATLLTWMQERKAPVFVVATANDIRDLPPEFLRKGRFDEVFWVDLPTTAERLDVLRKSLAENGVAEAGLDLDVVVGASDQFTGAEVAYLVPDAMFDAFDDGDRPIATKDLLRAAENTAPIAKVAAEKIDSLRKWGATNAKRASLAEEAKKSVVTRGIDLEDN